MQCRYFVNQPRRDQAPYHAENRATDRGEAQHRGVQYDGAPGQQNGENHGLQKLSPPMTLIKYTV